MKQSRHRGSIQPILTSPFLALCLVGDPQQLPVLTLSGSAANNKLFERSLFKRLQSLNFPTILLRNQYRMHEAIASFPSQQFYEGRLITPDEVRDRRAPLWTRNPCFPTVCFWDLRSANMSSKSDGHGFKNADEANFIMRRLLPAFAQECSSSGDITVGIITFYRDQVCSGLAECLSSLVNHWILTIVVGQAAPRHVRASAPSFLPEAQDSHGGWIPRIRVRRDNTVVRPVSAPIGTG